MAVIRTAWLAVFCLSGLGAMAAINAGTSKPPPAEEASPGQTSVGKTSSQDTLTSSQDTLTKADRLEIAYVRDAVAAEPAMPVAKAPNVTPPQAPVPTAPPKIVSRHWQHDPNAKKSAAVPPGRRIKDQEPKKSKNADRGKATVDLRACRRPEGFAGLLRALNLSPGCDT